MARVPTLSIRAYLIDMDGVLYHGERVLPGAPELLRRIADHRYLFVTNNPILPAAAVAAKLARLGLGEHAPEHVLTSATATASRLAAERPGFRYYAVGAPGLHQALAEVGTADDARADYVVIGEGAGLDYESLARGINLIVKVGARLVVTNPDLTVDGHRDGAHYLLPGGGALVAPFAAATGQAPLVIGKPQPLLFEMALRRLGVRAEETLMIGDRPDTDIAGAVRLGLRTALVRTGRFAPGERLPTGVAAPDWDVCSLEELLHCMKAVPNP